MQKVSSAIVLSLLAGAAAAGLVVYTIQDDGTDTALSNDFDESAAIEERVRALEAAVSEERRARQLLEEELLAVYAELDSLENAADAESPDDADSQPEVAQVVAPVTTEQINMRSNDSEADEQTERRAALIAAGLSPARADHILQRESEMQFEMMQARYEARNSGEPFDRFSMSPDALLRADIGDADYEKYLQANDRPTSVNISSVMAASPAERAGLQPGDQIVSYDGERVFSTFELMQHTMASGDGDVVVDVLRNGATMQIVLPRGPIGVEIGRFRGR